MAKLRHVAMVVEDMEKTALFYEKAFDMQRVRQTDVAIGLSDGTVSLVIISTDNIAVKGDSRRGLHHIGFVIDDMEDVASKVEANGAKYHGVIPGSGKGPMTERKYLDPNGSMFDIATGDHVRNVWRVPADSEAK